MKKYYLLLLFICGMANAQVVNIPNAVFKAKLLSSSINNPIAKNIDGENMKIDVNSDGDIQVAEALLVYELNVMNSSISSVVGIESFANITKLVLDSNNLSGFLDVSMLTQLEVFYCNQNDIASLNVAGLTNLTTLWCSGNLLITIDVTSLSNLVYLRAHENQITTIDLSGCPLLYEINLANNQLASVDLTDNLDLYYIYLSNNPNLTAIDVSNHTSLYELDLSMDEDEVGLLNSINTSGCTLLHRLYAQNNSLTTINLSGCLSVDALYLENNLLTTLDVSDCLNVGAIRAHNNLLTSIDVSNCYFLLSLIAYNNPLEYLYLKNGSDENVLLFLSEEDPDFIFNPDIEFICADETQLTTIQNKLNLYGITGAVLNTYCTFEPGGNYNTIYGKVNFDSDNNGCDASDIVFNNVKLTLTSGSQSFSAFTNQGNYKFYTQTGNYSITTAFENNNFFVINPTSTAFNFPTLNNNIQQDFCVISNGNHQDLEIVLAPIVPARPGFDAVYKIVYKNKGNQIMALDYGVTFFYNQNLMSFVSADIEPDTNGPGALSWNYANLKPFEARAILVTLHVNPPTDLVNPVNIGDVLTLNTSISPIGPDENQLDNYGALNQTVVGSYDPNDIQCLEGEVLAPSEIGKYLHYLIRFENTGTAAAENIVVATEIDANDFDVTTLQLLNASHDVDARQNGNKIEFIFENIMLDSGGHGNILLKVKSKSNLVTGDAVNKMANIFFDYNFPVATNNAQTTYELLSVGDNPKIEVSLYPNPTNGLVTISANEAIRSITVYDIQGRLLESKMGNQNKEVLDMSNRAAGVYFIKITSDKGAKTQKIMKK